MNNNKINFIETNVSRKTNTKTEESAMLNKSRQKECRHKHQTK